jgi:hypothetical protein
LAVNDLLIEHGDAKTQNDGPLDQHPLDGRWIAGDVIGEVLADLSHQAVFFGSLVGTCRSDLLQE